MRDVLVRFVSLLVFNTAVLLLIGFFTPARVGFGALWAALVMTILVLFIKPLVTRWFQKAAARSRNERTSAGEYLVQTVLVLIVAWIVWVLTVLFSGVDTRGSWFWAFVLPPIFIAIGWFVYSKIADRVHAKAGEIYDRIDSSATARAGRGAPADIDADGEAGDGLTPEQRRMLDEL